MDKQLPPMQQPQAQPQPQPQPTEIFRSQPISGFFFPRKDLYDDWGLSAEDAVRRAEDLMAQHVHKEAEVLSMLMYAAFRDHSRAMYLLGKAFFTGSQEIVDKVIAEHWLRRCVKLGGECSSQAKDFIDQKIGFADPDKDSRTANGYLFGTHGYSVNYRMAFPWCKHAAEHGNEVQMNNLAALLWQGYPDDGIQQNKDQARGWLLRAANTGYLQAIETAKSALKLDLFPHAKKLEQASAPSNTASTAPQESDGINVAQLEDAIRDGDTSAYLTLGQYYENKDMRGKAALCLELAYRNGYADEVCEILADYDEEGESDEDFQKALETAEDEEYSVNSRIESLSYYVDVYGYSKACEKLGDLYFEHEWNDLITRGRLSETDSNGGSSYYYLYGAVCGYYNCMERIGSYLEQGRVFIGAGKPSYVKQTDDPAGAAFWYLKCCDHLPRAAERLGDFYRQGIHFSKNPAKAIEYYKKAHEQDPKSVATLNLGEMYYYGEGCVKDWRTAKRYLQMVDYQDRAQELLNKIKREHPFGV